ncbi:anaerobic ribonucleoside-triphosphate reductase [Candidatus Latescibacterota bacterium]
MLQTVVGKHAITLQDEERQECEIWTRVMGYYRPVSEFNIGKKSEHFERIFFIEEKSLN